MRQPGIRLSRLFACHRPILQINDKQPPVCVPFAACGGYSAAERIGGREKLRGLNGAAQEKVVAHLRAFVVEIGVGSVRDHAWVHIEAHIVRGCSSQIGRPSGAVWGDCHNRRWCRLLKVFSVFSKAKSSFLPNT